MKKILTFAFILFTGRLVSFAIPYSNQVLNQLRFQSNSITASVHGNILKGELVLSTGNIRDRSPSGARFSPAPEASWILFMPRGSTVTGLSVQMGEKWVKGKLVSRSSASDTYDTIVGRARQRSLLRDPGVLEEIGPDIYRLQVFPVTGWMQWISVNWYAPLRVGKGIFTLILNEALQRPLMIRAAEKAFDTRRDAIVTISDSSFWINGAWTSLKVTNATPSGSQPGYSIMENPYRISWKGGKGLPLPEERKIRNMMQLKREWQQRWNRYGQHRGLSWKSLQTVMRKLFFVGPSRSLIAVEPGMRIRPGKKRGILALPGFGNARSIDGFGGYNGMILPKNVMDRLLRMRKPYYKRIKDFYRELETRDPARILTALRREHVINTTIDTPYSLFRFLITSNITQGEMNTFLRFVKEEKRTRVDLNNHIRKRAKGNPLFPLYRLHVLCDFAKRFNLRRYGVSPWDLFLYLEKK